jgi:hypothetical protein
MSMMRPGLLLAAYHGMERAYSVVGVGKSSEKVSRRYGRACLPSQAERFRRIIREQFVRLYEKNDVLAQVLECAREDLDEHTKDLPDKAPAQGSLDIKQVLDAEFAFA